MKKILSVVLPVILLLGAAATLKAKSAPPQSARSLEVQLHYTGAGQVDSSHKIYVAIWKTADFVNSGEAPISVRVATSKDDSVIFPNISRVPVYVSATYDPSGRWDAESEPPGDASLGVLSKDPPKPDAVDIPEGERAKVVLSFDDSVKVRGASTQ